MTSSSLSTHLPSGAGLRSRTISTPAQAKSSDGESIPACSFRLSEQRFIDHSVPNQSRSVISDVRRASASTTLTKSIANMSSPLGIFTRRRRSAQPQQAPRNISSAGDVIEIGHTSSTQSRKEDVDPSVCEDEEMDRLREAAARALGLELGRDNVNSSQILHEEASDQPAMPFPSLESKQSPYNGHSYLGAVVSPSSLISLPTSQSYMAPSVTHSARSGPMSSNSLPSYPCSLAALSPFAQASSSLLTHYPSTTFLAIALNRRAKQWKLRYIVFTSPPSSKRSPLNPIRPHADFLTGNGKYDPLFGRHYHLHLFKSATPSPDEVELDRLEINEDSGVYIIDREFGGKRDVLKVAGRDIRAFRTANPEPASDELGRITWHLKLTDLHETQRWVGYIRSSVLQQRAERASLNYPHLAGNQVPSQLLTSRADLDSLRSTQISNTSSPRVSYQPPKVSLTPTQSMFKSAAPGQTFATHTPSPNPRYVEHVGAAPSHLSTTPSVRARTHPSPSALNGAIPALRNLFRSPSPSLSNGTESTKEKEKDLEPKDIDPISPEDSSLGQRATALLGIFRTPSSRASSYVPSPAAHAALIGKPISPTPYSDTTLQRRKVERENDLPVGHHSASSVDWSMIREEVMKTAIKPTLETSSPTNGSLSPPPRNLRRPTLSASLTVQTLQEEPSKGKKRSSSPPTGRPPSTQSTSNSSYASAQDQPARSFESERRRSRAAPAPGQKLTPRSPSPIFEDRDATSPALNPPSASVSSVSVSMWGAQHPYSKRISVNSSASINTVSTGHGSAKHPPPPRPPPSFAPPPAPLEREVVSANGNLHLRDSVMARPLRLSLNPPAAPPTHSLPPRPDEPGYRSRRSTSSETRGNTLAPISAGSVSGSVTSFGVPPPASSPPSGPLPPTPDSDNDRPSSPKVFLQASLTRRLRIMSSPPPSTSSHTVINKDAHLRPPSLQLRPSMGEPAVPQPAMFLHLHDTPISPPMALGHSFLTVSPIPPPEDDEGEPTSLPPPPRRSSRGSKEIRNLRFSTDSNKCPIPPPPAGELRGVELELF